MSEEYYKTKESVEEYITLAKDVNGKQLIEQLKQILPAGSTLLELGSGPGTDWEILSETYTVTGSDFSPEFLTHLTAKYPAGDFLELDAISLITDQKFDGIYANKVLHHLKDEEIASSVERQYQLLNPEGIICHSFWKGEGSEVFKGMFVNYHDEMSLRKVFGNYFEVISIVEYPEFEEGDSLLLLGKRRGWVS